MSRLFHYLASWETGKCKYEDKLFHRSCQNTVQNGVNANLFSYNNIQYLGTQLKYCYMFSKLSFFFRILERSEGNISLSLSTHLSQAHPASLHKLAFLLL
jgi:hypothetical protein